MRLTYHILDVFTQQRFGGNPLAVVLDAQVLSSELLQKLAREFNLSETVFVLKPHNASHSAMIRIFTPSKELPFAGHPTVGAAALLAELKAPVADHDALVVLEQTIGTVRVGVKLRAGRAAFAEFDAPKLPAEAGGLPPLDRLAAGLDLIPSEIGFEIHRPSCYAAGNAFAFIPVATQEAIAKARVNAVHWAAGFQDQGFVGAYLYTRQCTHTGNAFHVRVFAPDAGILEDPATGSAAVCFAGVIAKFDKLPDGTHKRNIEQGYEMGRPSQIGLTLQITGGKLVSVRIGGHAVRVAEGFIEV